MSTVLHPALVIEPPLPDVPAIDAVPLHDRGAASPLWMVTTEPLLNQFVVDLQRVQYALTTTPGLHLHLRFSRRGIAAIRSEFAGMIRQGEAHLHRLAQLLCATYLGAFQVESVVIGAVASTNERFTLTQQIAAADVYGTTDLDLGTRQLQKLRVFDGQEWSDTVLVANTVEYQPTEPNPHHIYRINTRIKAEESIWNKVVDELFDLDTLVRQDKDVRHLSRYVKDIFGIKIVVGERNDGVRLQAALEACRWSEQTLTTQGITPAPDARVLHFLEVKDYLRGGHEKSSGWEALKSVVQWNGKPVEIQIQPLRNFLHERERLTQESHVGFKTQRELVRAHVAERVPLFGFYGALLRWLFLDPTHAPPTFPGLGIVLEN